jgi:2-oxoglutarate ferredoxin oxidoreductase subunit delta
MTVHVDTTICKGCGICIYHCPTGVLDLLDQRNQKGYNVCRVVEADRCKRCQLCEICCPDFALYVEHDTDPMLDLG